MTAAAPLQAETPEFDSRAFRNVLGDFATGVTVMTASAGGRRAAVTANSFNSLSLDPPLILWSLLKSSSSLPVFEQASHFAVNILADHQIEVSQRFSRPGEEKFSGADLREGPGGCLLLPEVSAWLVCESHSLLEGGDHWILLGRVLSFESSGRAPLLYHRGAYSVVRPHPG